MPLRALFKSTFSVFYEACFYTRNITYNYNHETFLYFKDAREKTRRSIFWKKTNFASSVLNFDNILQKYMPN